MKVWIHNYAKTWLQFIFPVYIWTLSAGIVGFSRVSGRISQLTGKNSVQVLATLFLLSFGKLIRAVISAVLFTNIVSYDGTVNMSVWLLDANVHYLQGKHRILFVAACVTAVVALIYAFTLTFIQCLRRVPNRRMCWGVQRLKPFLDAYTGPYKDRYQFWTGLLLLVRMILFFTINPSLNFTLIITVSTLLITGTQNGIYKKKWIGLLDSSLLILFSTFMMFTVKSAASQRYVVCGP